VEKWMEPHDLKVSQIEEPKVSEGTICVDVKASGCNFFDILLVQGKYQLKPSFPFTPGSEFSGIVSAVGTGTSFKVGDKVFGIMPFGSFAEKIVVGTTHVWPLAKGMSFEEGAAFGMIYPTSYAGLVFRGNLQKGEFLLVHAAAGGVGSAAVQIGRALGATVIATVGSTSKVEIAKKIGAHHVIDLSKQDMVSAVKSLTNGKGADVIYDPVGGDVFDKSIKCAAWNGRIVVVGFAGGTIPTLKVNLVLLKNIAVTGLHWGAYAIHEPHKINEVNDALIELYSKGLVKPVLYPKVFSLEQLPDALALIGSRNTYGKLLISMDPKVAEPRSKL